MQAKLYECTDSCEATQIWFKPLSNGSVVLAYVNLSEKIWSDKICISLNSDSLSQYLNVQVSRQSSGKYLLPSFPRLSVVLPRCWHILQITCYSAFLEIILIDCYFLGYRSEVVSAKKSALPHTGSSDPTWQAEVLPSTPLNRQKSNEPCHQVEVTESSLIQTQSWKRMSRLHCLILIVGIIMCASMMILLSHVFIGLHLAWKVDETLDDRQWMIQPIRKVRHITLTIIFQVFLWDIDRQ